MSVEVAINPKCRLGEGPHWDDEKQNLLFVDIKANKVYTWDPVTKELDSVLLADTVGSVVPCKKGGYLVGLGRTISHLDWSSQKVTKLHEIPLHGTNNRMNDGKCDPAGRFWTGSMGHQISNDPPQFEMEKGELYCLDTDGSLHRRVERVGISNGLVWTQDRLTMYYIDTVPRQIFGFDYDVNTGEISNRRVVIDYHSYKESASMGRPDGMTIDSEGNLWVANNRAGKIICFDPETGNRRVVIDYNSYEESDSMGHPDGMTSDSDGNLWVANYGVGKIICFDPRTGKILRTVNIPALKTTSCCFGGKNLDELYVTCAMDGSKDAELAAYPNSGSLFKVTGLGVKGQPANVYEG